MKKLIKQMFTQERQRTPLPAVNLVEQEKPAYQVRQSSRTIKQTYLLMGCLGPVFASPDQYGLDVMSIIMGQGRTSRLFRALREDAMLVWDINAGFYTRTGSGMFSISATCDPSKKDAVRAAITAEINRLSAAPPTPEEINRAKTILESQWMFDNETYHQQAANLGYYGIIHQLPYMKTYLSHIRRVTGPEVSALVRKYLDARRMAESLVVPHD
jgi:zinc protease